MGDATYEPCWNGGCSVLEQPIVIDGYQWVPDHRETTTLLADTPLSLNAGRGLDILQESPIDWVIESTGLMATA